MPTVANLTDSLQMKAHDMTRLLLAVLAAAGLNFGVAGAASGADEPTATAGRPGDWPQWGGSPARNNAPCGRNIPAQWNVGQFERKTGKWLRTEAKNIKWVAKLGTEGYGSAVVAGGKIFAALFSSQRATHSATHSLMKDHTCPLSQCTSRLPNAM